MPQLGGWRTIIDIHTSKSYTPTGSNPATHMGVNPETTLTPLFHTRKEKLTMARNMVTRTIISTEVNALCLNLITAEPFNQVFTLAGTYKDNAKIKREIEKVFNNDEHVVAHIVSVKPLNTLYGMTEQKFIENAEVLPPRKSAQ